MADTSTTYVKAKRKQLMAFLNTTPSSQTPTWNLMGKGITGQTINYNPQTTTETYIHEVNATISIDSYQPTINTPQTVYAGEPCFEFVNGLRKKRATGDDAVTELLLVNAFEQTGTDGSYSAEKNACSIQIDEFGGDAGKPLSITYTINLIGDPVQGTFAASSKTFTAAESA